MNKPFLLVVEDDHAVRNLITTTLETKTINITCGERKPGINGSGFSTP